MGFGILPAHGLLGASFSATSMIGFMAGAGIVVRSSIILADPIFKGLANAFMAGEIASLLISRLAVPVPYFMVNRSRFRNMKAETTARA